MPWLAITLDVSPANAETLVDALLEAGAAQTRFDAAALREASPELLQRLLAVEIARLAPMAALRLDRLERATDRLAAAFDSASSLHFTKLVRPSDALALNPNYGEGHFHLGNVFQALGRIDEAIAHEGGLDPGGLPPAAPAQPAEDVQPFSIGSDGNVTSQLISLSIDPNEAQSAAQAVAKALEQLDRKTTSSGRAVSSSSVIHCAVTARSVERILLISSVTHSLVGTSPSRLKVGPPELPRLTAASIWI